MCYWLVYFLIDFLKIASMIFDKFRKINFFYTGA